MGRLEKKWNGERKKVELSRMAQLKFTSPRLAPAPLNLGWGVDALKRDTPPSQFCDVALSHNQISHLVDDGSCSPLWCSFTWTGLKRIHYCKSLDELKKTYRKTAVKNHPDQGGNEKAAEDPEVG
ncbi:hypothetical protein AAHA92_23089 [Salvia divinorum]|uniref:J domain-containing protein n=1 Tax=Salvia divinorum TaxID=28513 RepID=A0ABD1GRX5_SALDI